MFIHSGDALLRGELTAAWDKGPFPRTPSETPPLLQTTASSETLRPPEDPLPQTPEEVPTEQVSCCTDSGMQQQC